MDDLYDWQSWRGNCYQAALAFVSATPGAVLVHGIVSGRGPLLGRRFGHAWAEVGDRVFDITVPLGIQGIDRDLYYCFGEIRPAQCRRYTEIEAKVFTVKAGHWGPWEGPSARRRRLRKQVRRGGRKAIAT